MNTARTDTVEKRGKTDMARRVAVPAVNPSSWTIKKAHPLASETLV
jgi:hypothetical protein